MTNRLRRMLSQPLPSSFSWTTPWRWKGLRHGDGKMQRQGNTYPANTVPFEIQSFHRTNSVLSREHKCAVKFDTSPHASIATWRPCGPKRQPDLLAMHRHLCPQPGRYPFVDKSRGLSCWRASTMLHCKVRALRHTPRAK